MTNTSCRALRGISEILKRVQDDEIPGTAREGVSGSIRGRSLHLSKPEPYGGNGCVCLLLHTSFDTPECRSVSRMQLGLGPRLQVLFFENVGMSSGIEHQKSQLFVILLPDQEPVRFYMALPFPFAITA